MSEEVSIYRKLQEHLDPRPGGVPTPKSGVEIRILKHLFTPEEAEIATKLVFGYESPETISKRIDNKAR